MGGDDTVFVLCGVLENPPNEGWMRLLPELDAPGRMEDAGGSGSVWLSTRRRRIGL